VINKSSIKKESADVLLKEQGFNTPFTSADSFSVLEIWKDVKDYEGLYQISNCGRVRNKGIVLKLSNNGLGYLQVKLSKNNIKQSFRQGRRIKLNLTEDVVLCIRKSKEKNQSKLAGIFNISRESINAILRRRTWKHV